MFELFSVILLVCAFWYFSTKRPKLYPPGPNWLPIVGNTWMLREAIKKHGSQIAAFQAWQSEYKSDVIGLKLGSEMVVVALNYPNIHEVYANEIFHGRPDNFFIRLRTFGSRLGITFTEGNYWTEQKDFVLRHLKRSGYGRNAMGESIQHELNGIFQVVSENEGKPVWPGELFSLSVLSILWTFTAGKRLLRNDEQATRLLDLLKRRSKVFDISGGWLNAVPILRFIAPEWSSYNLIKRFNNEVHDFFMTTIEDHKRKFSDDKVDNDLIFAFISEMNKSNGGQTNFTDTQLVMVILDLFIGGSHSTNYTLDFIMLMLTLRPDVQKKCHEVIDSVLGSEQLPSLEDKSKLSYVEAVILETQRFCNVAPVGGPRRAQQDSMLGGYAIPKDTTIFTGLDTINTDVEYWGDPHVFRPERFLNENNEIVNTERLVIFALGKRRCLGEALAKACLFTFTVGILQKFTLEIPSNGKRPEIKYLPGLLVSPAPYEIVFKRRKADFN